jgi:Zn-dependent protease
MPESPLHPVYQPAYRPEYQPRLPALPEDPGGWQPTPAPRERRGGGGRGAAGSLLALLAALGKYGVVLLKVGKFGPTLVSMVLSLGALTLFYGPAFGAGLLALIAVHESGHLLFARREGIKVSAPIFLGPLGAVIGLRQPPKDARQEAVIAIGGPVVGTAGALVAYLLAQAAPAGSHLHGFLVGLAYVGFLINLFNLIPLSPLDGGRVVSALSRWANVAGLVIVVGLLAASFAAGLVNPFLVLILALGVLGTVQRFRQARRNPEYLQVPAATRLWIGAAYAAMLAITALGMSIAHSQLAVHVTTLQ